MADDKTSAFEKAVAAYKDVCDRNNVEFHQPSEEHSNLIHDLMYLRINSSSYVARYDVRRKRCLA